jgi:hypothetical protein
MKISYLVFLACSAWPHHAQICVISYEGLSIVLVALKTLTPGTVELVESLLSRDYSQPSLKQTCEQKNEPSMPNLILKVIVHGLLRNKYEYQLMTCYRSIRKSVDFDLPLTEPTRTF